jgi:hypothetical protein
MKTNEEELNNIIQERLKLQTTQRYLEANGIHPNTKFLTSKLFKKKYNSWLPYKRMIFLKNLAGVHWEKMKERIEK